MRSPSCSALPAPGSRSSTSKRSARQRLARFDEQFPDAIDLLARAVRAGHAFTTGFELIAAEMPEPVAGEFRIVYDQQQLGLPLREALDQLALRVPSGDVMVFVSALQIQRETGGNLAEILDKLSHVIRERFKLHRQIRVFTAEGRMSLWVLIAVPFVAGLGMFVVNRDYLMPLLVTPGGPQDAHLRGRAARDRFPRHPQDRRT